MHSLVLVISLGVAGLFASGAVATKAQAQSKAESQAQSQSQRHAKPRAHGAIAGAMSGIASVYGGRYSGGRTASGERASSGAMTAAHRTLPFGSMVQVTNRRNGRSAVVRINDRGPFVRGRVIDVTPAAARALGFSGTAAVTLAVVGRN